MASVNLSGILKDSLDEIDVGAIIKFTHLTTTGEVINTTEQVLIVPPDGAYNIDVNYGLVRIDYTTKNTERYVATVTVNDDTVATTLPELIGTVTPVTEESLLFMQALVADANDAADRAESAAGTVNVDGTNTSVGIGTLESNTFGANGVAIGLNALSSNTIGSSNTAAGASSLLSNTEGGSNTATGVSALLSNTTGSSNTATGVSALLSNTTSNSNTATGVNSLRNNTTGNSNTATGVNSLQSNTTGSSNTATGVNSLRNNTTGRFNTAIGRDALNSNTTGSGNTAIAPIDSAGVYNPVFNPTAENDRFCAGSASITHAYVQVPWTVVSDSRDKTEFNEIDVGLEFINALNPVIYKFRKSRGSDEAVGTAKYGFKAQDVLALEGENPIIVDNENPEKLRMIDTALIPVLVKSIQQLTEKINSQQEKINELKGD